MRGWALVWQHWKLSVCLLVSPTVQCACETSTLCHHVFVFFFARARMGKTEQINKKKRKEKCEARGGTCKSCCCSVIHGGLVSTDDALCRACVFICSSGRLWVWCYELGRELSWVCQQMCWWITHAEINPDERQMLANVRCAKRNILCYHLVIFFLDKTNKQMQKVKLTCFALSLRVCVCVHLCVCGDGRQYERHLRGG